MANTCEYRNAMAPERKLARIEAGVDPPIKEWLMQPHINTSGAVRAALREYIPEHELAELSDEKTNDGEATPSDEPN